jgi:hypothetical protein
MASNIFFMAKKILLFQMLGVRPDQMRKKPKTWTFRSANMPSKFHSSSGKLLALDTFNPRLVGPCDNRGSVGGAFF